MTRFAADRAATVAGYVLNELAVDPAGDYLDQLVRRDGGVYKPKAGADELSSFTCHGVTARADGDSKAALLNVWANKVIDRVRAVRKAGEDGWEG